MGGTGLPWENEDEELEGDLAILAELMQERPDGNVKSPYAKEVRAVRYEMHEDGEE